MSLKKVKRIMWGIFAAMVFALVVGTLTAGLLFAILGTVLFFVFIGFSFANWRCPYCDEYLGWNTKKACPFCEKELDGLE